MIDRRIFMLGVAAVAATGPAIATAASRGRRTWVRDIILGDDPPRVIAVDVTERVGDLSRTIRCKIERDKPVEIWQVGDEIYIIPRCDAESGKFPWRTK